MKLTDINVICVGDRYYKVTCKCGDKRLYVQYKRNGRFAFSTLSEAGVFRTATALNYCRALQDYELELGLSV